jgi:hypothetical protein
VNFSIGPAAFQTGRSGTKKQKDIFPIEICLFVLYIAWQTKSEV